MAADHSLRNWGQTPPLSTNRPTEKDLTQNDALLAELRAQKSWELPERTRLRENVLKAVQIIVAKFVTHIGQRKKIAPNILDTAGGLISPFGSYRLGVHGPSSDIDTLVLAPKHVTHTDFFEQFPDFLRQNAPPGAIEELVPVPSGSTPIIKLVYSSIDMDLAFVSLHRSSVPRDINVRDEALLRGLDDREARSFNGVRVAAEMLELIPQPKTFSYALRAIKLWAKRRAIDANIVGFPGGIAWAIMVARICQLYPNACGSLVVSRFFYIIKVWKWSVWKPLELRDRQSKPDGAYAQWNPHREKRDALHLMPVITPTYPCMCTTHAVNKSTLSVILRELERGDKIVNQIFKGEAQWKDLFVRHTFFSADYKYYLCIVCSSQTKDDNKIWSGLVKSKVRHLVIGIMNSPIDVVLAHPYTEGFERIHQCNTREQREQVLQGNLAYQVKGTTQTTDETNDIKHKAAADGLASDLDLPSTETGTEAERRPLIDDTTEETTIYTTTFYIGIEFAKGTKSVDLTAVADDFKWMCTAKTPGTAYDQNSMALRIAMVKNVQLPDDVFVEGETRPVKSKKRTVNDAQLDVR